MAIKEFPHSAFDHDSDTDFGASAPTAPPEARAALLTTADTGSVGDGEAGSAMERLNALRSTGFDIDLGFLGRVAEVGTRPTVIDLHNGDTVLISIANRGTLDTSGYHDGVGDLYVFAPFNLGTIVASDDEIDASGPVPGFARGNDDLTLDVASTADADVFIFAPDNTGTITGTVYAQAAAEADVRAGTGTVTLNLTAKADANLVLVVPGNSGFVDADATVDARTFARVDSEGEVVVNPVSEANADVTITEDTSAAADFANVFRDAGGLGRIVDLWL